MTLHSMTGYGSAQCDLGEATHLSQWDGVRLSLELRSVNSRFLDLSFRLPDEWRAVEASLREMLSQHLARGKVELRAASSASGLQADHRSVNQWSALHHLEQQVLAVFPQAHPLSVVDVLRLSDRAAPESSLLAPVLMALCKEALQGLQQTRRSEGQQLGTALMERIESLRALIQQASPMVPQWVQAQKDRFLQKWQEAMALAGNSVNADTAHDRALTEATALALRADVSEELTRLNAHLDAIEQSLTGPHQPKGVGKRLDFLIQELHREANTLGAKSSTLGLTQIAVDMKVLIEQMREQVQNLE